jgi:hypothetical protein
LGLSNRMQALTVAISAGPLGVGTYIAISPAPEEIKAPLAVVASSYRWPANRLDFYSQWSLKIR